MFSSSGEGERLFLIFPLGHDRMEARRWPLVTLGLIVVCSVVLALQMFVESRGERRLMGLVAEAVELVREVRLRGVEQGIARDARLGWADAFVRRGLRPAAETLYRGLMEGDDALGLRAAIAVGTLAARGGRREEARDIFEKAKLSPHMNADLAQRIEAQLAGLV